MCVCVCVWAGRFKYALLIVLQGLPGGCNMTAADLAGVRNLGRSTCSASASAIAGGKETWCRLGTVFSVGPPLMRSLVTAEPKGAHGTADEAFVVLTCACHL